MPPQEVRNALNQFGRLCSVRRTGRTGQFVGEGGALQMPIRDEPENRRRQGGPLNGFPVANLVGVWRAKAKRIKKICLRGGKTCGTRYVISC